MSELPVFGTRFGWRVSVDDVFQAALQAPGATWDGDIQIGRTPDGLPAVQCLTNVAGEEVLCESWYVMVFRRGRRACLVTAVREAPIRRPQLAEGAHRAAVVFVTGKADEPVSGDEALSLLQGVGTDDMVQLLGISPPVGGRDARSGP
jgi:hypothetical protein